jgi:uncharacterized protein (TIGR00106 family)
MLAQFSIVPIGVGESLSRYVAEIVKEVEKSGLDYRLTAMATIVEGSDDEVFALLKRCHQKAKRFAPRVLTTIIIDDRKSAKNRLTGKVLSVENRLGKRVKSY